MDKLSEPGMPMSVAERHKPFEKKCCARCNKDEFRIDGYCSVYCRDMAEVEDEVAQLEVEKVELLRALEVVRNWVAKKFNVDIQEVTKLINEALRLSVASTESDKKSD